MSYQLSLSLILYIQLILTLAERKLYVILIRKKNCFLYLLQSFVLSFAPPLYPYTSISSSHITPSPPSYLSVHWIIASNLAFLKIFFSFLLQNWGVWSNQQIRQACQERQAKRHPERYSQQMATETGWPELDSQKGEAGQPERGNQNIAVKARQLEQAGRTRQAEQDRQNKTPRYDFQSRTPGTWLPEQDCQNRTARAGQPEQDYLDSQNWIDRTRQDGQNGPCGTDLPSSIGLTGQDC